MQSGHSILNVAIVGVGEVAMTTHLPTLMLADTMFKTVAIMDISQEALAHCSRKFHVPATYTDVAEMLKKSPEIDVVMIMNANEYHVLHAVQCLEAGKHVFIEKPMAITESGAKMIEAARVKAGKVVFVGYMRRYAEAFLRVKELVRALPPRGISYVRVRDIIGRNAFFVDQSGTFARKFSDFPPQSVVEKKRFSDELFQDAIGDKSRNPLDVTSWSLLNGLASHDLSAMRELIGMPKRVISASRSSSGLFTWVTFEYEGFVAYYEMGIDSVRAFDAHIEVYAGDKHFKVTYDTPYVKGLPITAQILSSKPNGDHSNETLLPTYEDAYTLEYRRLYAAIVDGEEVKTTPKDAMEDLRIFKMIMDAF